MTRVLVPVLLLMLSLGAQAAGAAAANRYVAAGVPATGRQWSGADYRDAMVVLGGSTLPLPIYRDADGAAVLDRFTSLENLRFATDPLLSGPARLQNFMSVMRAVIALNRRFATAPEGPYRPHREIATLLAFMLRTSMVGVDLIDEMAPGFPHDDKYAARMDGVRRVHSGFTTEFVGDEEIIARREPLFSPADLSLLIQAMSEGMRVRHVFAPALRAELARKLKADAVDYGQTPDGLRLLAMSRALRVSTPAAAVSVPGAGSASP